MNHISQLKEIYTTKGICFGLGAGISINSNIPSWEKLLQNIAYSIFKDHSIFNEFIKQRFSFEAFASFLKVSAEEKGRDFNEIVRAELYGAFKENVTMPLGAQFVKEVDAKNITLSSIGIFCAVKDEQHTTIIANPMVHGIINFNIDRLLRVYTHLKFNKNILRTVERPSAGRTHGKINVYHIHGMMKLNVQPGLDGDAPDKLVFAEDEYYQLVDNTTNVFNYSFLYLLREYSFLFIGLSMQDQNLRRLLYLSKNEIKQGYESEKLSANDLANKLEKLNKHFAILKDPQNDVIKNFHERTLIRLGVKIIWVNKYDEIQGILKDIYANKTSWQALY